MRSLDLYVAAAALLGVSEAQKIKTGVHTVTPQDVAQISRNASAHENAPFQRYDPAFDAILGHNASLTLLFKDKRPLFHEGGVYVDEGNGHSSIYAVSNQFPSPDPSPSTNNKTIVVTRISTDDISSNVYKYKVISPSPPITLANGATFYDNALVFTAQGDLNTPGGLVHMSLTSTPKYKTKVLINNYLGQQFNSPNDVVVAPDARTLIFTDPPYGFTQAIRPRPALPPQAYAFTPGTTNIRVVAADGLKRPNGVTLSPDARTAYISDAVGSTGDAKPRTIYAYDVAPAPGSSAADAAFFLSNKRAFALPAAGIPDGIKTDAAGNVYAGCADGVNVWSPAGALLGKIAVPGGTANFAIAPHGRIFVFNEQRVWLAQVSAHVGPAVVNRLM